MYETVRKTLRRRKQVGKIEKCGSDVVGVHLPMNKVHGCATNPEGAS